jgi:putative lipoic acid-binding regulatory protein
LAPADDRGGAAAAGDPGDAVPDARARASALLEATHQFPCAYFLTVIALHDAGITERLVEAVKRIDEESHRPYSSQPSSGGKYVSHRFSVRVSGAHEVLELYEVVRTVEGVVTVM